MTSKLSETIAVFSIPFSIWIINIPLVWWHMSNNAFNFTSYPTVCSTACLFHSHYRWSAFHYGDALHFTAQLFVQQFVKVTTKKMSKFCIIGPLWGNPPVTGYWPFMRGIHQSSLVTGPLWGEPPVTGGFPSQRASNVETFSTSWHYHELMSCLVPLMTDRWGSPLLLIAIKY